MLINFDELISKHGVTNVRGILHVGAHTAEERNDYSECGINRVIWIEANPGVFLQLMRNVAHLPGHSYHWFAAIEENDKIVELNIASNGESSSIFDFDEHTTEHPSVTWVGKTRVLTRRIDDFLFSSGYDPECFNFVNLDIQGAELLALKGMSNILNGVDYIYTEVNEKYLYKNCCLIGEIDDFLSDFGFSRKVTEMTRHGWGDALYARGASCNEY